MARPRFQINAVCARQLNSYRKSRKELIKIYNIVTFFSLVNGDNPFFGFYIKLPMINKCKNNYLFYTKCHHVSTYLYANRIKS